MRSRTISLTNFDFTITSLPSGEEQSRKCNVMNVVFGKIWYAFARRLESYWTNFSAHPFFHVFTLPLLASTNISLRAFFLLFTHPNDSTGLRSAYACWFWTAVQVRCCFTSQLLPQSLHPFTQLHCSFIFVFIFYFSWNGVLILCFLMIFNHSFSVVHHDLIMPPCFIII